MAGPQVVKTSIKVNAGPLSPAARQAGWALYALIAAGEDPAVKVAKELEVAQIMALLLQTAAGFHEGEVPLERVMGALLSGAAWIAHHHDVAFESPQDPRPPGH